MNKTEYFTLNNGREIPKLGLGTFASNGDELEKAIKTALKVGYRLFDTSLAYKNETSVGQGLWGNFWTKWIDRKKVYVTSKLFLNHCLDNKEYSGLKKTLKNLNTTYLDNYLLHWALDETYIKNYKEMEKFYKDGLVKNIGVCNMDIPRLEKLLNECDVIPAINQVEITPVFTQKPLIEFCKKHNILVMAYTPFARMHEKLFNNEILLKIAEKYNKKPTQIILKWNIQQGRSVIPKSANPQRIKDNFNIFDFNIESEDLKIIDSINENFRVRFDPNVYPKEWLRKHNAKRGTNV